MATSGSAEFSGLATGRLGFLCLHVPHAKKQKETGFCTFVFTDHIGAVRVWRPLANDFAEQLD